MRYQKHYTRSEARALLPAVRQWLDQLIELRHQVEQSEQSMLPLLNTGGDLGGPLANKWVRSIADMKDTLLEFHRREIQVKDLDRGLIDFPALLDGNEVFLCWESGEDDIEFWHELDAGYAGREPLGGLE